jgi:hypothetical protein
VGKKNRELDSIAPTFLLFMERANARRPKELEKENAELKKRQAEPILEDRVLKEVNSKK